MQHNIEQEINKIRIIDGHEHLATRDMRKKAGTGFFGLLHYVESDLITAGMERDVLFGKTISIEEKATIFLKYWNRTKNTTYARMLQTAVCDLYGMDDWTVNGVAELNQKVIEKTNDDSWYAKVLNEYSGIDLALTLIQTTNVDYSLFRPVMFMDFTYKLRSLRDLHAVEKEAKVSVRSLKDYLNAVDTLLNKYLNEGMVATKLGHAYWRTLRSSKSTFGEAEHCFNHLMHMKDNKEHLSDDRMRPFQDYMIHYIIQRSTAYHLPIQIHTGHHETSVSGDGNNISNSRVGDLVPLLAEYKDAKFVLLHGGFPYYNEYLSIAKNYPNVYADLTWLYVISPTASRIMLHSLIEMVPQSKIQGFGGDYNYIEGTYAHQKLARKVISNVLIDKVSQGELTEKEAVEFADRILRTNLIELYELGM